MGLIVRRNQPDTPWFRLTEAAWHARVRGQDCYLVFDPEAAFWWMLREGVVVGGSGDREDAMTLADD